MIVDWVGQLPVLLVAAAIVFLPGALVLRFAGLRGLAMLAGAPLFSVSGTAVIALAFGRVGVAWTPLVWAIAMAALVGIAALIGRWAGGRLHGPAAPSPRWMLPLALGIGAALSAWRIIAYVHDPSAISQTNDAVFHMNAVRYILETDNASSLHVNSVIGGRSFYPAAWHALVSLVTLATGAEIAVAANMLTVVIAALIWPMGIAWLASAVTRSARVSAYAAVLAGSLQTFPLLMFQWGVLFPNALSTAMIPAAIAIVITVPAWRDTTRRVAHGVRTALLILAGLAALLLAQPAGVLPWMAACAVWVSGWMLSRRAESGTWRVIAALGVTWLAVSGVWLYLAQGTSGSHWPPFRRKAEALLDVLLNGQVLIPFAFAVSILMIIGLVAALRTTGTRWFVVVWAGISGLYVLVAGFRSPLIRDGILGAWYADPYRIAALAPIVAIPLAAVGLDALVTWTGARSRRVTLRAASLAGLAGATVLMIVLILVRPVAMPAFTQGTFDRESRYVASDDSFLSPDERDVLEALAEEVPASARVLGNPSTGSGFGYFLSGIDVYPRTWAPPTSPEWDVLAQRLRDAATDPAVCDALHAYGDPEYVLDFGPGDQLPGHYLMPGMTDFAGQPGFERAYAVGDASLWRITACAQ